LPRLSGSVRFGLSFFRGQALQTGGQEASPRSRSWRAGQLAGFFLKAVCLTGCHLYSNTPAATERWAVSCLLGGGDEAAIKGGLLLRPLRSAAAIDRWLGAEAHRWPCGSSSFCCVRPGLTSFGSPFF